MNRMTNLTSTLGLSGRVRVVEIDEGEDRQYSRAELRKLFHEDRARVVSLGRNLVVTQGKVLTAYLLSFGQVVGMFVGTTPIGLVTDLQITQMEIGDNTSPGDPDPSDTALDTTGFHTSNVVITGGANSAILTIIGALPANQYGGRVVTEAGLRIAALGPPDPHPLVARILFTPAFVKNVSSTYQLDWELTVI